jgi:hypothetical protein
MGEDRDPLTTEGSAQTTSQRPVISVMLVLIAIGAVLALLAGGIMWGLGVTFGGVLSIANYVWLDRSTRAIFVDAEGATTTRLAVQYIGRYFALGTVLLVVYLTGAFPMPAVLIGLAAFGFAVVFQGLRSIFSGSSI